MPKFEVEFHTPEHIISLRLRDESTKKNLDGYNPNSIYVSKRVMVVGRHHDKGYKGFIKSTTSDGYAFLQLDARPQQSIKIQLTDLASL